MTKLARFENLLLALWVGIMAGIGYVAAPVLFKTLDEKKLAGNLAGEMFYVVMIVGLVIGILLLILRYKDEGVELFKQWRGGLLLLMFSLVAATLFVLLPMISEVKALGLAEGSDSAKKFGMLHGASSLIYMITVISGCILIFCGLRAPEKEG